jgi:acyl carrier protein
MHHNSKDWLFFAPINDSKKLVMSDIASRVHSIIIDKLGVPASEVTAEASFTGDLGADSLDPVELIMEFEKEFDISIPDDQAEGIGTVGQAIAYIEAAKA